MLASNITEEQARKLASGSYGRASLEHIASYGVPLFIVSRGTISPRDVDASRALLSNGTAFVVDLGCGPFAITANHVVDAATVTSVTKIGLFPKSFDQSRDLVEVPDLKNRIIIRNIEKDIATFRVTREEVAKLGVTVLSSWPSIPVEGKGGIGFIGYPGTQRKVVSVTRGPKGPEMTLNWAVFPGFGVAASVSDRQITFQFDRGNLNDLPSGFSHPDMNLDPGGMSGGPILMKRETPSGIEYWVPAGVITEGKMAPHLNGGFLFASRLDGLGADGKI